MTLQKELLAEGRALRLLEPWNAHGHDPVEWLREPVLIRGKLTLLAGEGGVGKSMFACALAAELLRMGESVVYITTEADPPELDPFLGDLDEEAKGRLYKLCPDADYNLDALRTDLAKVTPVLVVFDPITDFLDTKEHNDNALVRAELQRIRNVLKENKSAGLLLTHENKNTEGSRKARVMGSTAFVNVPRLVFRMVDKGDERLVVCTKANIGPERHLRCVLEERPPLRILETFEGNADRLLGGGKASVQTEVTEALRAILEDGPKTKAEIQQALQERGVECGDATLRRAADALRIDRKRGPRAKWRLPGGDGRLFGDPSPNGG